MMASKKIILPIVALVAAAVGVFFLAPLQAWKKKTGITRKEVIHSGIIYEQTITYTPDNCNFAKYCYIWWTCYFGTQMKYTNENHTYEGGELPEVTITPNANS